MTVVKLTCVDWEGEDALVLFQTDVATSEDGEIQAGTIRFFAGKSVYQATSRRPPGQGAWLLDFCEAFLALRTDSHRYRVQRDHSRANALMLTWWRRQASQLKYGAQACMVDEHDDGPAIPQEPFMQHMKRCAFHSDSAVKDTAPSPEALQELLKIKDAMVERTSIVQACTHLLQSRAHLVAKLQRRIDGGEGTIPAEDSVPCDAALSSKKTDDSNDTAESERESVKERLAALAAVTPVCETDAVAYVTPPGSAQTSPVHQAAGACATSPAAQVADPTQSVLPTPEKQAAPKADRAVIASRFAKRSKKRDAAQPDDGPPTSPPQQKARERKQGAPVVVPTPVTSPPGDKGSEGQCGTNMCTEAVAAAQPVDVTAPAATAAAKAAGSGPDATQPTGGTSSRRRRRVQLDDAFT